MMNEKSLDALRDLSASVVNAYKLQNAEWLIAVNLVERAYRWQSWLELGSAYGDGRACAEYRGSMMLLALNLSERQPVRVVAKLIEVGRDFARRALKPVERYEVHEA